MDLTVDRAVRQHVPVHQGSPRTALPTVRRTDAPAHRQERPILVVQSLPRLQRHAAGGNRHVQAWFLASTPYQWRRPQRRLTAPIPREPCPPSAAWPMSRTPCGTPSAQRLLDPCARPVRPSPAAGPEGSFSASRTTRVLLICVSSALCEGSPGGLPGCTSHRETLRGQRYSVPVPAGAKTGSLCARMCARRCRPQPRHGPGVIA